MFVYLHVCKEELYWFEMSFIRMILCMRCTQIDFEGVETVCWPALFTTCCTTSLHDWTDLVDYRKLLPHLGARVVWSHSHADSYTFWNVS